MKPFLFLRAFCCLILTQAQTQTQAQSPDRTQIQVRQNSPARVILTGCPSGMYADLGKPLPYTTGYEVDRKEAGGQYIPVGRYIPCTNSSVLYQRMTAYAHILPGYALPTAALSDTLWKVYRSAAKEGLFSAPFPLLQLALGSCFLDTTARQGRTYQYRFRFTDSLPAVESPATICRPSQPQYASMQSQRVLPEKKTSLLEWRTAVVNAAPFFEAYRRQSGTAAGFLHIPVTRGLRTNAKTDSLIFMVIDSSVMPGITYDYFIVAKDYLGNSGNHSDTVRLQSGGRRNVPAVFNLRTRSDGNGIQLRWARLAPNTSLQNIVVLRSAAHDSGYAPLTLLPVTDTMYTDKTALGGQRYFYQLIVQGAFNYSLPTPRVSGMFTGPVNLLPPYGLAAFPLPKGVRLSWQYANRQDIAGFKVYRSASPQQKMQLISDRIPPAKDSLPVQFTDTTAGSDKTTFYYAVAAVSHTSTLGPLSNIVSSAPAAISKVPAPDGLRYLWLNDSVVSITWRDLQRETPGIASYRVYKKTAGPDSLAANHPSTNNLSGEHLSTDSRSANHPSTNNRPADSLLRVTTMNEFTDTLQEGEVRWYRITTMNTAGSSSVASPSVRIEAPVHRPLPPGRVHAYRQGKNIVLDWDGTLDAGIREYRIYKAEDAGKTILVDSLKANSQPCQYIDAATRPGTVCFYYVTSVTGKEQESRRSEEVRVRIN